MHKETEEETGRDAPAFDFYCERWTHGTRHMTKVERCDYLDLLLHQWTSDGLPGDLDVLARLVGYRKGSQISALVVEKFPVAADGKRRNTRLEQERAKQRDRIRRKRAGAAITNAKKEARKAATASGRALRPMPGHARTLSENDTLSDTDSVTLSVSHSERLACAERHDIVTPPPTTHHPPQGDLAVSLPYPPKGSGWPASEEQCRSLAVSLGVDPDYAATLWNEHDSTGDYTRKDEHGVPKPILKFSGYLKFRWAYRSRKNDDAKALEKTKAELRRQGSPPPLVPGREGGGTNGNGAGSKPTRPERAQRPGEIPSDVGMDKVKVYRWEESAHA